MERKVQFAEGEFYHLYNRGVAKQDIFSDAYDRDRFQRALFLMNGRHPSKFRGSESLRFYEIDRGDPLVAIGSYCLMPNHFHMLIREICEGGISAFMEKLGTSYSSFHNKRHKRVGPLFQGRFQARHVESDNYLKYLFAYIHLNPIKLIDPEWKDNGIKDRVNAKSYLDAYDWSSYIDYSGKEREERLILNKEEFPNYFTNTREFDEFISDWLAYADEEVTSLPSYTGQPYAVAA